MQPALYTIETVRDIRTRAMHGQRLRELARYLGWDIDRLRTVARKHEIHIVDEGEAQEQKPIAVQPKVQPPVIPRPTIIKCEIKKSDGRAKNGRRGALKENPRNRYVTVAISISAFRAISREAERLQKSASSTLAVTLDHLARRNDFRGFVDSAFAEISR